MALLCAALLVLAGGCTSSLSDPQVDSFPDTPAAPGLKVSAEEQIRWCQERLAEAPRLYPVWAQLAAAHLDRSRTTHDVREIHQAEEAAHRSLDIQPNLEAFRVMAALACFRHRFPEALVWAGRAAETLPADTGTTAIQIEALVALGRLDEARLLLDRHPGPESDFHLLAARARLVAAQGDLENAVTLYRRAAAHAQQHHATSLAVWALVRAAATQLDAGWLESSQVDLEAAANLDAQDRGLRLHQAEAAAAAGDHREALATYETLLEEANDPLLHAAAFSCCRHLGLVEQGRQHYEAAERRLLAALEAGELFPLAPLARLDLESGTNLQRALELARRNLESDPNPSALALIARIEAALDASKR